MDNTKKILAPYVRIGFQGGLLYLGFGSIQKVFSKPGIQSRMIEICDLWTVEKTRLEIFEEMLKLNHRPEEIESSIRILESGNFLIDANCYEHKNRYSRHLLYYALNGVDPQVVQDRLARKSVMILGCGGIGNQIAVSLATAGIGEIVLVDDDKIEISNLTRQILFSESDAGKPKVEVLARELRRRTSEVRISTYQTKIYSKADLDGLESTDLIILSADSSAATNLVNEWAIENTVPYLPIGYINDIASWGPFVIPGKTACFACVKLIARDQAKVYLAQKLERINMRYQAPSVGPVNMLASSLGLLDALRFLGEYGEIQSINKRVGLWTHNLRIETQELTKNPQCKVCSHQAMGAA